MTLRADRIGDLYARRLSHALHTHRCEPSPQIDRAALLDECIADYEAIVAAVAVYEQKVEDAMHAYIRSANAAKE